MPGAGALRDMMQSTDITGLALQADRQIGCIDRKTRAAGAPLPSPQAFFATRPVAPR
jgi:hypothetical protein